VSAAPSLPLVVLVREPSTPEGTFGRIVTPDGRGWHSLELPWRDNVRKLSCIPAGTYRCAMVRSPRFGHVYGVQRVPQRTHILIHGGNLAGQIPAWKTHVQGCILLGERRGRIGGQRAVLVSKPAVRAFQAAMGERPFLLEVRSWN
jgi:hypothetical protein